MYEFIEKKMGRSVHLTESEKTAIATLPSGSVDFAAGEDIVREGEKPSHSLILLEGLACRYRATAAGLRQIIAFQLPGDWIDLHSYILPTMDHSMRAVSACRAATIPYARLDQLGQAYPHLTKVLWRDTMIDSAVFREWVVNVGARNARERMAHLFCEVHSRMLALGLATETEFNFPVTQEELAEATGISTVHANRCLMSLRQEGLLEFKRGVVTIQAERLRQVADFDDAYLHAYEGPHDTRRELVGA